MVVAANITEQLQSRYQTFYGQAVVKIPHFITRWNLGTRLEKLLKYRDASNFFTWFSSSVLSFASHPAEFNFEIQISFKESAYSFRTVTL